MGIFSIAVGLAFTLILVLGSSQALTLRSRTFAIDYEEDQFLLDGKPFRYVAGSFHYFRAVPQVWRDRLKTMKAAGLNAIDTYVEWSLHNPKEGEYSFSGIADLENFVSIAQEEGLYVILRPGPYICAERDNGGLPYWLFTKYPGIKPRTSDSNYLHEVGVWYEVLMKRMKKFFYGNGGPIIMVQVENEYGSFGACDHEYLNWLRDETEKYVQGNAVLFTTDMPNDRISCGKIQGVFATVDFGVDRVNEIDKVWKTLRTVQPNGPLVNSEFYSGWLTNWQGENQRRSTSDLATALRKILSYGASVNFYMFFGGTNFGFTAGANGGANSYTPDITSYDYDAVMNESGDPTLKFELIRDVLKDFMCMSAVAIPRYSMKAAYGSIEMEPIVDVLSMTGLSYLSTTSVKAACPKTFEELDQYSGLVLYETVLPKLNVDPTVLTINDLRDRAFVYIDDFYVGTLSRQNAVKSLPINEGLGEHLQILVENQGRINFDIANDVKGILGAVTIQQSDGSQTILTDWTSSSLPLESEQIARLIKEHQYLRLSSKQNLPTNGPVVFYGSLQITNDPADTYLDTTGWGKGVAYINNFNLGRYWPLVGPQITLYVPKDILRKGLNDIVLIEYETAPSDLSIQFIDIERLDGI